jgi:UDP-N-acetylglucosamine diphosphorylase/glucosamine-1-phosphate N-acetyltransferase
MVREMGLSFHIWCGTMGGDALSAWRVDWSPMSGDRDEAAPLLLLDARCPLVSPDSIRKLIQARLPENRLLRDGSGRLVASYALEAELRDAVIREMCRPVECRAPSPGEEVFLVVDPVTQSRASAILADRVVRRHLEAGVWIEDPGNVRIGPRVRIAPGAVLRGPLRLEGETEIGAECEIGPSVRIRDCSLGDRVTAQFCVLTASEIGSGCRIGPFTHLRPGCRIGRNVKLGNYVELKNALVEDGVSIGHLAYVGDAEVGAETNIGAGSITCNYDGRQKHRTRIGRRVFLGSHTTLIAPVEVGDGAYTAAGTVITRDVPADALAVGRARQSVIVDWARRRRQRHEDESTG